MARMINEQSVLSSMVYSTSPVMNRCNISKMVMRLDLNLTPLENDLSRKFYWVGSVRLN
ncbi:hypothetical protein YC2023_052751 [Brassica napus]